MQLRVGAAILILGLGAAVPGAEAQRFTLTPALGFSKDLRSETSNRWEAGVTVAASVFTAAARPVSIGVRVAAHRWSADAAGWLEDEPAAVGRSYTVQSSSGSQTTIEIIPSLRLPLRQGDRTVHIALQLGAGVVFTSYDDVVVSGTYTAPDGNGQATHTYPGASETGFGGQFALPVTIGRTLQITPLYSVYRTDDLYQHFGITLGSPIRL